MVLPEASPHVSHGPPWPKRRAPQSLRTLEEVINADDWGVQAMAGLLTKPIAEVTFQDVQDFCQQQYEESDRLDYKAEFPRHMEHLIAAFANTIGGTIILGVGADKDTNRPVAEIAGMPIQPNPADRITQISNDNILPPPPIEVSSVLQLPNDKTRCVMVVRVPMSPYAPHATDGGTTVYERRLATGKPWSLADINRIELLLRRRQEREQRREEMIEQAEARYFRAFTLPPEGLKPCIMVSACPYYPYETFASPETATRWLRRYVNGEMPQIVPDGAFEFHHVECRSLHTHGLAFLARLREDRYFAGEGLANLHDRQIGIEGDTVKAETRTVNVFDCTTDLWEGTCLGIMFLRTFGYQGFVNVRLKITGLLHSYPILPRNRRLHLETLRRFPDRDLVVSRTYSTGDLEDVHEVVRRMTGEFTTGLSLELDEGDLSSLVSGSKTPEILQLLESGSLGSSR